MLLKALREEIVFYGMQLLESGMTMHTGGNLSARDPQTGLIAIKPSARAYRGLQAEEIAVIDANGSLVEGGYQPSSEWRMHAAIYRRFPQARAVVHCHSPYATALAALGTPLPLVSHELCCYCSKPVITAPFAMPGSEELGLAALNALGEENEVAFLQNHGQVAYGASLWHAMDAACAAEQAAQVWMMTRPLGKAAEVPEQARKLLRAYDPLQKEELPENIEIRSV